MLFLVCASYGQDVKVFEEKADTRIRIICTNTLTATQPLFVLQYKQKEYVLDTAELKFINPENIKELTVLMKREELEQYGDKAENDVVLIKVGKSTMNKF